MELPGHQQQGYQHPQLDEDWLEETSAGVEKVRQDLEEEAGQDPQVMEAMEAMEADRTIIWRIATDPTPARTGFPIHTYPII